MLILVLGGARSGKSRYAQSLCNSSSRVIYIATAGHADDPEMRERIARHRADRPVDWHTIEEPIDLSQVVSDAPIEAALLIDCATLWISNLMWKFKEESAAAQHRLVSAEIDNLIAAVRQRSENCKATVVIVSNVVGGGLVPEHPVARAFRDLQGFANQRLAEAADKVVFIIAGLPLVLKPGTTVT